MAGWMLEIFSVPGTGVIQVSPVAVAVQAVVGLAVPLLAAAIPVIGGARFSPHQAIGTYGLGGQFGRGLLDRVVGRIRWLPRPMALSLRNTFRRKGRVALTLLTFTLVGVMFIMVASVRVSLDSTVEAMLSSMAYDAMVVFARPYRAAHLVETTGTVSGVTRAEVWDLHQAQISLISGEEKDVSIYGMPPDSQVFRLRITSGRGLLPGDGNAMLLSSGLAVAEGYQVGDEVVLTIAGEKTTWTVVGLTMGLGYVSDIQVPFDTLVRKVGHVHRGGMVMVISEAHDAESQERLIDGLSDVYTARHIEAKSFMSAHQFRERGQELFDFVSYLLLTMALLAAVVGGIGLTGTLSINVVERRREIGVMRAIGAPFSAILGIFIGEGVFLGLLSWLLAVPLSIPGARLFGDAVGSVMFETTLDFSYSLTGVVVWLAIVLVLSVLASLWPALRAARVSVRESLAYE
jgi:putative ABC transport system permease protein